MACHAQWDGYDLHAGVRVPAGHRDRLERVCRYALRPALAEARLARTPEGDVVVHLRRPWADGTTALVFTASGFLARVAVLVPRPRVNLLLYHGVLAPRAAWRPEVVPQPVPAVPAPVTSGTAGPWRGRRGWRWADLMRRVFAVDVLACPQCGGRLRLIATLEASAATRRILQHLGLPTEVSMARTSFTLVMLVLAGGMALVIGVVGIYGVIAYLVSQRTREIGIRTALGAQPAELLAVFVRQGLSLAGVGAALGLATAAGVTRLMSSLLFGVTALDPMTYVAASALLIAAAVLASYLPACRATAVDPVQALRAE